MSIAVGSPTRTRTIVVEGVSHVCPAWLCKKCGRLIGWNALVLGIVSTQCWHNRCKADNVLVNGVPKLADEVLTTR